jgi:broad specificity phosphatase PhoE
MLKPHPTKIKQKSYWSCQCKNTEVHETQKIKLIAMRHGESEHNIKGVVNGNPSLEFHITEKGQKQARDIADALGSRTEIVAIITSEMLRTQETAKPLAEKLGLEIQIDPRLNDIHAGELEGIPILEFRERTDNIKKSVQGSETNVEVGTRLKSFLDDLVQCYSGHTVAVISSEIILHSLQQVSEGKPCDEDIGEHLKHGIYYEFEIKSPICCPSCGDRCEI